MSKILKLLLSFTLISAFATPGPAMAETLPAEKTGKITTIYADPVDVVIRLDVNGPCGGDLFIIRRSATNFQELTALTYTAAAQGRLTMFNVTSCEGARNVVSHSGVSF